MQRLMMFKWLVIALSLQVLVRVLLFQFQFHGVNYFGGDSGIYLRSAEDLSTLNYVWPMGWPLLLRVFFSISDSLYFLLAMQVLFALAAQVIFTRVLVRYGKHGERSAFFFSQLFFLNPAWIRLNSLTLMADTVMICFMMASVLTVFYIYEKYQRLDEVENSGRRCFEIWAFAFLLGCSTFFKHVLRIWSGPIFLALVGFFWAGTKRREALISVLFFIMGPAIYIGAVQWPRFQTLDYDLFSGYSIFSNIVPFANCDGLVASFPDSSRRELVREICQEDAVQKNAQIQLWTKQGFMGVALEELFIGEDRPQVNRELKAWSRRLLFENPSIGARAMAQNFTYFFEVSHQDSLSFSMPTSWPVGERYAQNFFHEDLNSLKTQNNSFRENHLSALNRIDVVARFLSLILRWGCASAALLRFTFLLKTRRFFATDWIWALTALYGAAVSFAGFYEPRAYITLDVLMLLATCLSFSGIKELAWRPMLRRGKLG